MSEAGNPYRAGGAYVGAAYVLRDADHRLRECIRKNSRFVHVVGPRFGGKTSLITHIRNTLGVDGSDIASAVVDLSVFSQDALSDFARFEESFLSVCASHLAPGHSWKSSHTGMQDAFRELLAVHDHQIVVFVDELDVLRNSPFSDQFFSVLRALANLRSVMTSDFSASFNRLQFVLAGVGGTDQLIGSRNISPFNVAETIRLDDLTIERTEKLVQFVPQVTDSESRKLAREIHYWTGGLVYLSQRFCEQLWDLAAERATSPVEAVEAIAESLVSGAAEDMHFVTMFHEVRASTEASDALKRLQRGERIERSQSEHLKGIGLSGRGQAFKCKLYERVFGPLGTLSLIESDSDPVTVRQDKSSSIGWDVSDESPPDIPGYRVESLIGKGGFSNCWKALHVESDRLVAITSWHRRIGHSLQAAASVQLRLHHRHILPAIAAVDDEAGRHYLVTPFVEGGSVKQMVGKTDTATAVRIVAQVCDALQYVHSEQLVHHNIAPDIILLDDHGSVLLTGFGLSAQIGEVSSAISGTRPYMSDEQRSAPELYDIRSDLYSLGIVLIELLTGRLPYHSTEPNFGRYEILPKPQWSKGIDPTLADICAKATEFTPDRRFQSAAEFGEALRQFMPLQQSFSIVPLPPAASSYVRRQCDDEFRHALAESAPAILISGPFGCGKTSLMNQIFRFLSDDWVVVKIFTHDLNTERVRRLFFEQLTHAYGEDIASFSELQQVVARRPCAILLDDLDNLSLEAIEFLFRGFYSFFEQPTTQGRCHVVASLLTRNSTTESLRDFINFKSDRDPDAATDTPLLYNPKYLRFWREVRVPLFNRSDSLELIARLPAEVRPLVNQHLDQILNRAMADHDAPIGISPQKLQHMLATLVEQISAAVPQERLIEGLLDATSYSEVSSRSSIASPHTSRENVPTFDADKVQSLCRDAVSTGDYAEARQYLIQLLEEIPDRADVLRREFGFVFDLDATAEEDAARWDQHNARAILARIKPIRMELIGKLENVPRKAEFESDPILAHIANTSLPHLESPVRTIDIFRRYVDPWFDSFAGEDRP